MAKKYIVKNTNIFYNNQFYAIGDEITLTDNAAAKLVDVVAPVPEDETQTKTATKNTKTKNANESETKTPVDNSGDNTKTDETQNNKTENNKTENDKTNGGNA